MDYDADVVAERSNADPGVCGDGENVRRTALEMVESDAGPVDCGQVQGRGVRGRTPGEAVAEDVATQPAVPGGRGVRRLPADDGNGAGVGDGRQRRRRATRTWKRSSDLVTKHEPRNLKVS